MNINEYENFSLLLNSIVVFSTITTVLALTSKIHAKKKIITALICKYLLILISIFLVFYYMYYLQEKLFLIFNFFIIHKKSFWLIFKPYLGIVIGI